MVELQCIDCGKTFNARTRRTKLCDKCRQEHFRETKRRCRRTAALKKHRPRLPKRSLQQICRELEEYNKIHRTALTYGKFVCMTEGEQTSD